MNKNLFVIRLFILFCFHQALSQEVSPNDFQLSPYVGINLPQGELKDFSKNGAVFGISIDKYLSENFALGIDFNYQSNDFSNPFDFSSISNPYSILNTTNGKWNASSITVGPTYRLGTSKFNAEIFAKFGLLYLKTPQAESVFQYPDGTKTIFNLPKEERSAFGVTSGIRLNYQISKNLSLFLNPQYVYGSAKIEYCNCGLDNLDNPEFIIDQEPIKETFSPSYFNVNAGIKWNIGRNNINDNVSETDEQSICRPAILNSPSNQQDFYLSEKERPKYQWENQYGEKPEYYIFKLLNNENQVVFSQKTRKQLLNHNNELESIYKVQFNENGKSLKWKIESHFTDCGTLESETQTINGFSRSVGLILDFMKIECKQPAYDSNGNVHFTAKICVQNPLGNNSNLIVPLQNFTLTNTSNGNPTNASQISDPNNTSPYGGIILAFPLTLLPGQQSCFWVEFSRPIGEQQAAFHLEYYEQGFPDLQVPEVKVEDLTSCICDICDDWQIIPLEKRFWPFPFTRNSNMRIRQEVKILNADPIMKVDAEIISVQHAVNDQQCYTCTKDHSTMGLFALDSNSGIIKPNNGWVNDGRAYNAYDNPTKTYLEDLTNEYFNTYIWQSQTSQGVEFSSTKTFEMNISLPDLSKLECCHSKYKVCIRYTFTDINCQTCSELTVCYDYDSSLDNTGNGGIGSGGIGIGVGNQPGGILTPTQLTPKN